MRCYLHEIRWLKYGLSQQQPFVEQTTFTNKFIDFEYDLEKHLRDVVRDTPRITGYIADLYQIKVSMGQKKGARTWFTFKAEDQNP
jgi:hypothetical protein